MTSLAGKSVLLIVGGGIAAYKAHELVRLLKTRGAAIRIILTKAAEQFVTPLSLASLSGEKVHTSLFSLTDEVEMGHIQLSRAADLVVVAPATADLIAKMANGLAGDLATTTLLATDKPVLIAPAMNLRMWRHPATVRNVETLKRDGLALTGPNDGEMACGEFGPGRMAEPDEILAAIVGMLKPRAQPLAGKKVLITAGPTREPIDPVRFISNYSSGKQGYAIARAAVELGAETILVSGPVSLPIPPGVQMMPIETAQEMLEICQGELPADIAVFTAAVADWRVAAEAAEKLKKTGNAPPGLSLAENPDILATISRDPRRPRIVVGFAAETEKVTEHAAEKLKNKGCDLIVANDVGRESGVFGGDRNTVHLVSTAGIENWPNMSKDEVARKLMERLARMLAPDRKAAE
ncbi:bifunctional phosphopantothenoylcysteine decarboxylase/phosphopantothenate--cysteine ligase CoaBC [Aestuariivirga sp.]|uniref:bifunctional phosphopantothenoylcysteine decarboxylase/phosphopantothenate--cysteine ligase CoaBC n=1 Tax=Aestuariivirga sp. TaxID=2650926 RepID=UPI0025B842A8|nr:bifunctional phosphopantothenoylcysteine decarboxylase/phosphopantothenate--cysteine ligase CoaBC [Aestuariivirga sp.]MCA3554344.1 bifunctional phosphopantothenoylcysteine decarboxylase/phosphopantothenate--cysteine ligase CoaBC [Aestuariivirga sp.]